MDNSYKFFSNTDCRYFPCHKGVDEFNCLFCYCPMFHFENCPGSPYYKEKDGRRLKICTNCNFPHRPENYEKIMEILKER